MKLEGQAEKGKVPNIGSQPWRRLCAAVVKTGSNVAELGACLLALLPLLPLGLGEACKLIVMGEYHNSSSKLGPTTERKDRQRDLLPLPLAKTSAEEYRRVDGYSPTTAQRSSRLAWLIF